MGDVQVETGETKARPCSSQGASSTTIQRLAQAMRPIFPPPNSWLRYGLQPLDPTYHPTKSELKQVQRMSNDLTIPTDLPPDTVDRIRDLIEQAQRKQASKALTVSVGDRVYRNKVDVDGFPTAFIVARINGITGLVATNGRLAHTRGREWSEKRTALTKDIPITDLMVGLDNDWRVESWR